MPQPRGTAIDLILQLEADAQKKSLSEHRTFPSGCDTEVDILC